MGASFQAPHAAPGQRQMEMSSWTGPDGLFIATYKSCKGNNNNNNDNDNGSFDSKKKKGFRPQNYMGACFQAPCATPRQRQMEMHHVH